MPGFVDHYCILDRIGQGAMADTYAARDEKLHRAVVLKFVHPARVANDGVRRRFIREMRAASAVSHPFICGIYDVLEIDRQPVIVMEPVTGQTVQVLTAGRPLQPLEVCRLGRELAEALASVHAHGLVHRDVSAANVMIGHDGHLKLMDLGLAGVVETDEDAATGPTQPDVHSRTMLLGTPVYMAPELLNGGVPTAKSDLYAAGVVLYRMATGKMPFAERMTPDSLAEMLLQPPVPPSLLVAGVPPSLERAIMGLLEKDPATRFPSAASLAATLAVPERSERLSP